MYRNFFGLKSRPFVLTPNPDFLYLSKIHDLALIHLEYGILHDVGFIVLTGEIGAGKTTLLKYLLEKKKIKNPLDIAYVLNTNLGPEEFLDMLVKEFDIKCNSKDKSDLLDALSSHFISQYSRGIRSVIVVDEAQNLPLNTFEELRMLSNIDVGDTSVVQIILVGQPELKQRLSHPSLTQLAQRISVYYHLTSLPKDEVKNYIEHRLRVAGYNFKNPLFDAKAIDRISEASKGIPRLINKICDSALTYAYADGSKIVSVDIVEQVLKDNALLLDSHVCYEKREKNIFEKNNKIKEKLDNSNDFYQLLEQLNNEIKALKIRIQALESSKHSDNGVEVLEKMLREEREKNRTLERKLMSLTIKYNSLEKELKKQTEKVTYKDKPKKRKFMGILK